MSVNRKSIEGVIHLTLWHPRLLGFSFWLGVLGGLGWGIFLIFRLLPGGVAPPGAASALLWLVTSDGERRGFAITSDLRRDGEAWELWGPGRGMAQLNPITELRPGTLFSKSGFAINGGFWNEFRQPVGVCAGERGIHASRTHPSGLALAGDRVWIGPLSARVRLSMLGAQRRTSRSLELPLNPQPLPRREPWLLDPATQGGGPPTLEGPAQIVWLARPDNAPLRFNTTVTLSVRKAFRHGANLPLPEPPAGILVLVRPEKDKVPADPLPAVGGRWRLDLKLEQVAGPVRLATCAGPRLLREGRVSEALGTNENSRAERTWRTAVGCDAAGHRLWVLMLARGRDGLPGVTLRELAETLRGLGATEGLNLDGGSSSSVSTSRFAAEMHPLFPLQSEIHHAIFFRKDLGVGS